MSQQDIFNYLDKLDNKFYDDIRHREKYIFHLHLTERRNPLNHFEYMFQLQRSLYLLISVGSQASIL